MERMRASERGVGAVEFALIVPLLLGLVLGIVEIGWTYDQQQDIRHDTRQAARAAAINFAQAADLTGSQVADLICDRLERDSRTDLWLTLPDGTDRGDAVVLTLRSRLEQVTGMFDPLLGGKYVESTARTELETDVSYAEASFRCPASATATPSPIAAPTPTPTPPPTP